MKPQPHTPTTTRPTSRVFNHQKRGHIEVITAVSGDPDILYAAIAYLRSAKGTRGGQPR